MKDKVLTEIRLNGLNRIKITKNNAYVQQREAVVDGENKWVTMKRIRDPSCRLLYDR